MRRITGQGFNKEKLAFLLAAAAFAGGLYWYLCSAPVLLEPGKPISAESGPLALQDVRPEDPLKPAFYIWDGKVTRLLDPRTNELVNRERNSPFVTDRGLVVAEKTKVKPAAAGGGPPPPPPPPPLAKVEKEPDEKPGKKEFNAVSTEAKVKYKGIIVMGGKTYGMLEPEDGGKALRVQVGDEIPEFKYKVTKIEKTAIWVADEDNHPFFLRNLRYTDESSSETAMSDEGGEGGEGEAGGEKPRSAKGGGKGGAKGGPAKGGEKPAAPKGGEKGAASAGAGGAQHGPAPGPAGTAGAGQPAPTERKYVPNTDDIRPLLQQALQAGADSKQLGNLNKNLAREVIKQQRAAMNEARKKK